MQLYQGDCLEVMKEIPDGSVDMVLCDLPYGTLLYGCESWNHVIPFEPLWEQYLRVTKENAAILLFGREPFSSAVRLSNLRVYRYDWIWEKTIAPDFGMAKLRPRQKHEIISVFYRKQPTYHPQMEPGRPYNDVRKRKDRTGATHRPGCRLDQKTDIHNPGVRYPSSIQRFGNGNNKSVHPTQKPTALLEYLIRTYTDAGEIVLDNCMGSGSTGVACANMGREFIGIERDRAYFEIAKSRIEETQAQKRIV